VVYSLDSRRRKVAQQNILRSGITSDPAEAARIARKSFHHFGRVILESLKSAQILDGDNWAEHVEMNIPPEMRAHMEQTQQGIILATGHFGSWEMAAQFLSHSKPVAGITKRANNPYVDRLMQKRKPRGRFRLIPKYDPTNTNRFLEVLKNGEVLAFMIDQHARARGMMIDFFGRPASTHTAVALLHLVTKFPLYFGYCRRKDDSSYEVHAVGPLTHKPTGNKSEDIKAVLESLNRELEKAIRSDPTQYLWAHRRWR
jgi:KDO2-lipid IV(A) lauroyltransferase